MVWYQRNYFKRFFRFLYIFIFLVCSFYFLDFFGQNNVKCSPYECIRCYELRRLLIGNVYILYSHTLRETEVLLMFELFKENFKHAQLNNYINHNSFSISRFMGINNTPFPRKSPLGHFNISLDLYSNWQWNTGAHHQLTTHKTNSLKILDGFNFFEGTNLHLVANSKQLVSNELRFYDLDILKPIEDKGEVFQQIVKI